MLNGVEESAMFSGQKASLKCEPLSVLKVETTNMLLNGNINSETDVVCKYEGRQPKWVDEATREEVICDKECVRDEDCAQKDFGFCIDHRYDIVLFQHQ